MIVVLDANIIIRDFQLRSGAFQLLFDEARRGRLVAALPEVALREAVAHYKARIGEQKTQISKATNSFDRLTGSGVDVSTLIEAMDREARSYEASLRRQFSGPGGRVLPIPELDADDLVNRAITVTAPFSPGGKGFKDAMIWHSVLNLVSENERVAFVSANWKDFAEGDSDERRLLGVLEQEVFEHSAGSTSVNYFETLDTFVDSHVKPQREVYEKVRESLGDPGFVEELMSRIQESLVATVGSPATWPEDAPIASADVLEPEIVHAFEPDDLELRDTTVLDDDRALAVFEVQFSVAIGAVMSRSGFMAQPDDVQGLLRPMIPESAESPIRVFWQAPAGVGIDVYLDRSSAGILSMESGWVLVF